MLARAWFGLPAGAARWSCRCSVRLREKRRRPMEFVPRPCSRGLGLRRGHVVALVCSACRKPIGVRACSSRIPAVRCLSLACPREGHQREGHPSQRRLARFVRARFAVDVRLRRQHIPVPTAQCARSIARTLRASRPSPAAADGDWKPQRAPARQSQGIVALRNGSMVGSRCAAPDPTFRECGHDARAFAFQSLSAAAGARRRGPQGRREGSRRVCRSCRDARSANPAARLRSPARTMRAGPRP